MSQSKPVFDFAPAAGYTPTHFAFITHLLLQAGYPVVSGLLPSVGALHGAKVTIEEDSQFVRNRLVLPMLENEQRNVIAVGHSYSALPTCAALKRLGKSDRNAQGKSTSVIGQIHIAGIVLKGGEGISLLTSTGGEMSPHMWRDEAANLIRCDDPVPPMMYDVKDTTVSRATAEATLAPSFTCFDSPLPRAMWDEGAFKGRIGYVKKLQDHSVPTPFQGMFLEQGGVRWDVKEIACGNTPMLYNPEELVKILIGFAEKFGKL